MKKVIYSILFLSMFGLIFTSCGKDESGDEPIGDSKPAIANLAVSPSASVSYGDAVTLSGQFTDATGLSSYTVVMSNAQGELYNQTNMLTGKSFNLNASLVLPLPQNAQAGDVKISITLKNSGNQTVSEEKTISDVAVPTFEKLYLEAGGKTVEMVKDEESGLYVVEDLFAANAAGKIYAKADKSGLFWGWANGAVAALAEGNIPIGTAEAATLIISFNIATFELGIGEGDPWQPIAEAVYIYGTISSHWAEPNGGNIIEEQAKMKMTGYQSGDQKYWTWTAPEGGDNGPEEGMWGHINAGVFRFKIGGKEEYVLFDGSNIVTGSFNDESRSFMISTGGPVTIVLYWDGTRYNKVSLALDEKSVDYTNDGLVVNGLPLPASMSFAGGSLTKKEGTFWVYEGLVDLTKDQEFTATGVDLSKAEPDMDVFLGKGNSTWKMIGSSGQYLIRVDPFVYSIYVTNPAGYPAVIYMDAWGYSKSAGEPARNWDPATQLCLYRVGESSIYEATYNIQGWGDKTGWGPTTRFYARRTAESEVVISAQYFTGLEPHDSDPTAFYSPLSAAGSGLPGYLKVSVDLKDGFTIDEETNSIIPNSDVKYIATFTNVNP